VSTPTPPPRLVSINRSQLLLRTVDVDRLIDDEHSARAIWQLVGRLDLSLYHAQISAVEGRAGREHTDPHPLISLWMYVYSQSSVWCFPCPTRYTLWDSSFRPRLPFVFSDIEGTICEGFADLTPKFVQFGV
jgi:hypothetical protein